MRTLITPHEVVKYGPVDAAYPVDILSNSIGRIEKIAFLQCSLGETMYNNLLEDLSTLPEDLWEPQTYAEGATVVYDGLSYISIQGSNNTPPTNKNYWSLIPKFQSESNNTLWTDIGLRSWLSLVCLHQTIRYNTYKSSAKGLLKVKDTDDGLTAVSYNEYLEYKKGIKADADDHLLLIINYLKGLTNETKAPQRVHNPRRFYHPS